MQALRQGSSVGWWVRDLLHRKRTFEVDMDDETAALAQLTMRIDSAAHQRHQLFADRQSQAGAAVPSRGGAVSLNEWREQIGQSPGRYTDAGVFDNELRARSGVNIFLARNSQAHRAGIGELERVTHEICEYLSQPCGISTHPLRRRSFPVQVELNTLLLRDYIVELHQAANFGMQIKRHLFERQLAGFAARKVQNVI